MNILGVEYELLTNAKVLPDLVREYLRPQVRRLYFEHTRHYLTENTRPHLFLPVLEGGVMSQWKCLSCQLCPDVVYTNEEIPLDEECRHCKRVVTVDTEKNTLVSNYECLLCYDTHEYGVDCDEFHVGYHLMMCKRHFVVPG